MEHVIITRGKEGPPNGENSNNHPHGAPTQPDRGSSRIWQNSSYLYPTDKREEGLVQPPETSNSQHLTFTKAPSYDRTRVLLYNGVVVQDTHQKRTLPGNMDLYFFLCNLLSGLTTTCTGALVLCTS